MSSSPVHRARRQSLVVATIFVALIAVLSVTAKRPQAAGSLSDHLLDLHPSAAGDLDPTFNPGTGVTIGGTVLASAVQSDGKILLGGAFSSFNGTVCNGLVRVNSNGSIDTSFHSGGAAGTSIYSIVIQSDGKILIGGGMSLYDGASRNGVARLNVDGTLDATFNPGSGTEGGRVYSIAVQPDQKILLGGTFVNFNGIGRFRIVRVNTNGSVDSTFDPLDGPVSRVFAIGIQSDGKIVVGGAFTSFNHISRNYVARLNPNGSVDSSFVPGIGPAVTVYALTIQPDGKVIVGGSFTVNGVASMLVRLNGDGAIDSSFTAATGGSVYALSPQTDGKIVVAGPFNTYSGTSRRGIARANSNGSLDTSFNPGNGALGGQFDLSVVRPNSLSVQLDGKILFGGSFTSYASTSCAGIVRVSTDGSPDVTFDSGNGTATSGSVTCVSVQSDAKILIGGGFSGYNNVKRSGIARVNSDGSPDSSFDPGTGTGEPSIVGGIAIQADGKILIGGSFTTYNGIARNGFARLNSDGALDNSFSPSANGGVGAIAVQTDGRIVIGGFFTTYQGVNRNGIARINADGSLDSSFNPGSGLSGIINSIAIQQDGKILVAGNFDTYNGVSRQALVRVNADGSIDGSFNPNTLNFLNKVLVQNDGRILITGRSTVFLNNGVSRDGIARLNSDGSLDTAFNPGIVIDPVVDDGLEMDALAIQSDGRIIVGGFFARYDGVLRNGLARANLDGHIDSSFAVGSGAVSIFDATVQPDGKILIAGGFTDYNGTPRSGIARLMPGPLTTIPTIQPSASLYSVNEADSQVLVQVNRSGDLSVTSAVDYATSDTATTNCNATGGKASSRCDYLKSVGRLLFAANESTKTVSIPIVDDAYNEGSETFTFTLTNPSNANLGSATASITINDNDAGAGANPIDQSTFFVRQHYFDFLNRQPDQLGLDFWVGNIENCSPKPVCLEVRRIDTSASFYLSIEFQGTGYLVERLYKTAYGDATGSSTFNTTHQLAVPVVRFDEFLLDTQDIGRGIVVGQSGWEQQFEKNKSDFVAAFVQRARFTAAFPANMGSSQFVSVLNANAGNPLSQSERTQLEAELFNGSKNRGQVLRAIAEHQNLVTSEFNRAFVLMQYFGYLRRNPNDPQDTDYTGYDFWLTKLNQFNGNYINAEMVKAFLSSIEYRQRFGP